MDAARRVLRTTTSKPAQKGIIGLSLLAAASLVLLCFAASASALFYSRYMPVEALELPLYLQYGSGPHPHATASFGVDRLRSDQEYDVKLRLGIPPSPANRARGNFMVSFSLLAPASQDPSHARLKVPAAKPLPSVQDGYVVYQSRRPALLPYYDPLVVMASRVLLLGLRLLVGRPQSQAVAVEVAERMRIAKGSELPTAVHVEVESGQDLEIYWASLIFTARWRGLRWLMHCYPITTFISTTMLFWLCEIMFMGIAWLAWLGMVQSGMAAGIPGGRSHHTMDIRTATDRGISESEADPLKFVARTPSWAGLTGGQLTRDAISDKSPEQDSTRHAGEADDEDEEGEPALPVPGSAKSQDWDRGGSPNVRRRPFRPLS